MVLCKFLVVELPCWCRHFNFLEMFCNPPEKQTKRRFLLMLSLCMLCVSLYVCFAYFRQSLRSCFWSTIVRFNFNIWSLFVEYASSSLQLRMQRELMQKSTTLWFLANRFDVTLLRLVSIVRYIIQQRVFRVTRQNGIGQNGSNFFRFQFNWIEFIFCNHKSQISDKPKWV